MPDGGWNVGRPMGKNSGPSYWYTAPWNDECRDDPTMTRSSPKNTDVPNRSSSDPSAAVKRTRANHVEPLVTRNKYAAPSSLTPRRGADTHARVSRNATCAPNRSPDAAPTGSSSRTSSSHTSAVRLYVWMYAAPASATWPAARPVPPGAPDRTRTKSSAKPTATEEPNRRNDGRSSGGSSFTSKFHDVPLSWVWNTYVAPTSVGNGSSTPFCDRKGS